MPMFDHSSIPLERYWSLNSQLVDDDGTTVALVELVDPDRGVVHAVTLSAETLRTIEFLCVLLRVTHPSCTAAIEKAAINLRRLLESDADRTADGTGVPTCWPKLSLISPVAAGTRKPATPVLGIAKSEE